MIKIAVFTSEGKDWVTDKVQDVAPASNALCTRLAWGTGVVAEATTNTFASAFTEASEARTVGTLSQPTSTTDRVVGTITANGTKNITEVARTNVTTVGGTGQIMHTRAKFTAVPVELADSIAFTVDLVTS